MAAPSMPSGAFWMNMSLADLAAYSALHPNAAATLDAAALANIANIVNSVNSSSAANSSSASSSSVSSSLVAMAAAAAAAASSVNRNVTWVNNSLEDAWVKVAVPGVRRDASRVGPGLESPWVKVIASAPTFPPPGPSIATTTEVWHHFATALIIGAAFVLALGLAAAVAVFLWTCCLRTDRRLQSRPSAKPLICVSSVTAFLAILGISFYLTLGNVVSDSAVLELDDAAADSTSVLKQGRTLADIGNRISSTLNATIPKCPAAYQAELRKLLAPIEGFRKTVDEFNSGVASFPEQMHRASGVMNDVSAASLVSLSIPLILVLVCVTTIAGIVCSTLWARGNGRVSKYCVRFSGPLFFAPAILFVTFVTAAEFGFVMALASFCKDADANTLAYVKEYFDNTTFQVSCYYINGKCSNPFIDNLALAHGKLGNMSKLLDDFSPVLAQACHSPEAAVSLSKAMKETRAPIGVVDQLLSPQHIYPYYKNAVHDNACVHLISGIGWLVVFQIAVGLLCLPALTLMADTLLHQRALWKEDECPAKGLIAQDGAIVLDDIVFEDDTPDFVTAAAATAGTKADRSVAKAKDEQACLGRLCVPLQWLFGRQQSWFPPSNE